MQPGVGTNRYAYAGNDPVNASDPTGNFASKFEVFLREFGKALTTTVAGAGKAISAGLSTFGGVIGFIIAPSPANLNEDPSNSYSVTNEYSTGVAITQEEIEAGYWYDSGSGKIRDRLGNVVRDSGYASYGLNRSGSIIVQLNRDWHEAAVEQRKAELEAQGYDVTREVTFEANGVRSRVDLVVSKDGQFVRIEEVKTGNASLSANQRIVYPRIMDGSAIPVGDNARDAEFTTGSTLIETEGCGIECVIYQVP